VEPPAPPIDQASASALVRRFFDRYGAFDAAGVARLAPNLPARERQRIAALDNVYSSCRYEMSNPLMTVTSPKAISLSAQVLEVCSPDGKAAPQSIKGQWRFELQQLNTGAWIISAYFWS
jgi:hypothetical protein